MLVDDRIFVPLTFNAKFEQSLKVTAESVSRTVKPRVGAKAAIISNAPKRQIFNETSKEKPVKLDKIDLSGLSRKDMKRLLEKLDRMTGR